MLKKIFFPFLVILVLAQIPSIASKCSTCGLEEEERPVNLFNYYFCETDDSKILRQRTIDRHRLQEHPDQEYKKYVQQCNMRSKSTLGKEEYIRSQEYSIDYHTYNYLYMISEKGASLNIESLQWMKGHYNNPQFQLKNAYVARCTPVQWMEQYKQKIGNF